MISPHDDVTVTGAENEANGTLKRGSHSAERTSWDVDRGGHAELAGQMRAGSILANAAEAGISTRRPKQLGNCCHNCQRRSGPGVDVRK
jgi:hypothetical protein